MEMLERLRDIPDMHLNKKQKERLIKKFQKKLQHVQENDSHGDEHEPWGNSSVLVVFMIPQECLYV